MLCIFQSLRKGFQNVQVVYAHVYLMQLRLNGTRARAQDELTPLMMAARFGHADCARLLLDAGADKNATDKVRRVRCWGALLIRCWRFLWGETRCFYLFLSYTSKHAFCTFNR